MALTPSQVVRAIDVSGDNIKVFTDALNREIQGIALVDEDGDHTGTTINPLATTATLAAQNLTIFIAEYDASNNPIYICQATPGSLTSVAVWQIFKLSYDSGGNVEKKRWADGDADFDKIADDFSTYNYTDI
jgi:hypothetical protein